MEQPLRFNYQISKERIKLLWKQNTFIKLAESKKKGSENEKEIKEGKKRQKDIIDKFEFYITETVFKNRDKFESRLLSILGPLDKNIKNALIGAFSERDETAEICNNSKGKAEADSNLRDTELIPLKENIQEYFDREVIPYVSNAWIDHKKTKIGYEIPLTRIFYEFKELRPLEDI